MDSKSLSLNGKRVSYFDQGSGEPILLIHGWASCKESFLPIIRILRSRYRLIVPDLPGCGDSEELDISHQIDNYLDFLSAFIKELEFIIWCLALLFGAWHLVVQA